jgi:outer membrane scaffolding protein for murein synthesis (MipA/OmpV family)
MNGNLASRLLSLAILISIGIFAPAPVQAQQGIVPSVSGIPNFAGIGVGVVNEFEGSSDFAFGALPVARFGWEERYIFLQGNTAYVNLINSARWRFGPAASFRFGRKDVDNTAVDQMSEIDHTFELGAFGAVELVNKAEPRFRVTSRIEFLHDVGSGHEGFNIQAAARYWFPIHKILDGSIGLSTTYANESFMDTYFGVTSANAQRSGLPSFEADAGFKDISVTPTLLLHLSRAWHIGLGIRYRRLLSDAADSPIVKMGGTANQFAAGAAVIYAW